MRELAGAADPTRWPGARAPIFAAGMAGAQPGDSATVIGTSPNLVTVGVRTKEGQGVNFMRYTRLGLALGVALLIPGGYRFNAVPAVNPLAFQGESLLEDSIFWHRWMRFAYPPWGCQRTPGRPRSGWETQRVGSSLGAVDVVMWSAFMA